MFSIAEQFAFLSGALPGTLLAIGAVRIFRALNPIEMPPGNPVQINAALLAFSCVLAVGTAFLFGLVPAIRRPAMRR